LLGIFAKKNSPHAVSDVMRNIKGKSRGKTRGKVTGKIKARAREIAPHLSSQTKN